MRVDRMTGLSCVDAFARAIRRLGPGARVDADLDHGRVHVVTHAQSVEVARALESAGQGAHAMAG
jgi:copper chaperone